MLPDCTSPLTTDVVAALRDLVVPQAILTITNAILATSLLAKDLFSADIRPKKLSRTIGLMNLTSIPFGGMPMCHGAGGMAGQYTFRGENRGCQYLCRDHPDRGCAALCQHGMARPYLPRVLCSPPHLCRNRARKARPEDEFVCGDPCNSGPLAAGINDGRIHRRNVPGLRNPVCPESNQAKKRMIGAEKSHSELTMDGDFPADSWCFHRAICTRPHIFLGCMTTTAYEEEIYKIILLHCKIN